MNKQPPSKLTSSTDEMQDAIYRISHDLGAPLRHVITFSALLSADCADRLNEDELNWISLIQQSAGKAQDMLNGLLQYSRINTDDQIIKDIDLNTVWDTVQRKFQHLIQQKNACIESQPLPRLRACNKHYSILLSALLENSLRFQTENHSPHIRISYLESNSHTLTLIFEDNGIGVDPKYYGEITNLFRRLHYEDQFPGIGMGLAHCKRILRYYDGDIAFAASPLGGLKVTCTLPKKIQL